jgi:hypothetical protein
MIAYTVPKKELDDFPMSLRCLSWRLEVEAHVCHRFTTFRARRWYCFTFRWLQVLRPLGRVVALEAFPAVETSVVVLVGTIFRIPTHRSYPPIANDKLSCAGSWIL